MWGLNAFASEGYRWGQDLIFSYGPLGYLARPLEVGNNVIIATAAHLVVHVTVFAVIALALTRRSALGPALLFLLAYPVFVAFDLEFDYHVLAAAGLMATAAIEFAIGPLLVASAVIASPLIFIKFGTGLAAGGMIAAACAAWVWRQASWRPVAWVAVAFAACVAAESWRFFGTAAGFVEFVRWSVELSRGYNDAMSLAGPTAPLVAAAGLLALTVAVGWFSIAPRSGMGPLLTVFAVPLAFSAKHSFLRADWEHMPFFFGLLWFVGSAALLFADTRRVRILWAGVIVADIVLFVSTGAPREVNRRTDTLTDVITGQYARYRLAALVDFGGIRDTMREASRAYLSLTDPLPPKWIEEIGRRTVVVVPSEIALCPAHDFACVPYPTLQMYATLTQRLDRWAASRIQSNPAQFVIVDLQAIDGRNMVWDCPETWLALVEGWEIRRQTPDGQRALLRRREHPTRLVETAIGFRDARIGDWVDVPLSNGALRLAIDLRERPSGLLQRTLFRAAPVSLTVRTAAGKTQTYRVVVDTARSGILLHAIPATSDLSSLLSCCAVADPVRAFAVDGSAAAAFEQHYAVKWTQVTMTRSAYARPSRSDRPSAATLVETPGTGERATATAAACSGSCKAGTEE